MIVLAAFGLVATAGAFIVWSLRAGDGRRGQAGGDEPSYDELKQELAQIREEMRVQRSVVALAGASSARASRERLSGSPASAGGDASAKEAPRPLTPEEQERATAARFERYDAVFASQSRDPAWAAEIEGKITEAMKAESLAGAKLVTAACGSTMCRMESLADSEAGATDFVGAFPTALGANVSGTLRKVPLGDGRFRVITYLARQGHKLPSAPPVEGAPL